MAALSDLGLIAVGYIGRQLVQVVTKRLLDWIWTTWCHNHPSEAIFYEHARLWGQKLHRQLDPRKCHDCQPIR